MSMRSVEVINVCCEIIFQELDAALLLPRCSPERVTLPGGQPGDLGDIRPCNFPHLKV